MDLVKIDQAVGHYNLEQTTIRAGYKIEGEKDLQIKELRALADQLIAGSNIETKSGSGALKWFPSRGG